ncbi:FAD-binding and (Fe-S)-binding domain-containing protein [Paludibacter sp.]
MIEQFFDDIKSLIPTERVQTDAMRRLAWGTDAGFYRLIPQIVIHSKDEEEVVAIVRLAQKYKVPLTFRAAGTSLSGQAISDSVLVIAGKNWEKYNIRENAESIRLQPGIIGQRVNQILKPFGKRFPPDPASVKSAMVGGIVQNNAAGMSCGVHENSYRMIISARLILADGTVLDTGDEESKQAFRKSHPQFINRIEELRDKIRSDKSLVQRIKRKYSIKNVTGLNILPLVEWDDPFDIITRLIVGSEGTLAFLSEVDMKTTVDKEFKSNAMLFFEDARTANELVIALQKTPVRAVEFFDRKALKTVEAESPTLPLKDLPDKASGMLIKIEAESEHELAEFTSQVNAIIAKFKTLYPVKFTTDEAVSNAYWTMRSGIFPKVGGTRPIGTTCLIEDVAFPIEKFADAIEDLRVILNRNNYNEAVIYGHALDGNYHFILNQSFDNEEAVAQYEKMMNEVVDLVVDKYDGSLKAEHGTGRNIAPFVQREWGEKAFVIMKEIKELFDPENIFNPGVIFNDDPKCYLKNIKPLPETHEIIDKCIECGFCEVNCLSWGFTLSSRQRIIVQREISRLRKSGENPALLKELEADYVYAGEETCAGDGLCATSCPVNIDVGEYTRYLRSLNHKLHPVNQHIGRWTAEHFGAVKFSLKAALATANIAQTVIGNNNVDKLGKALHKVSGKTIPLWTATLPNAAPKLKSFVQPKSDLKVVYFPSCLNQMMGVSAKDTERVPLTRKIVELMNKAGYEVIFPKNMKKLCCGTIWESKGMHEVADYKSSELERALIEASENGKYPVISDQSHCLHRMKHVIQSVKIYEPIEFIDLFLLDRLEFTQTDEPITLHITCSSVLMKIQPHLEKIARMCSSNVLIPAEVGCCGFAGDKGFFVPELNKYALRKLPKQVKDFGAKAGYSNSRTCEIGLSTNTGVQYVSLVYLVDRCTK